VIEIDDVGLAKAITINSNNQNSIKPRDLKSTNEVQVRLKREFEKRFAGTYSFEIKRGESAAEGLEIITNEEAGRLLLAFDLNEPETCHQVYKLFDDKYSEIFARPAVTADRVVFLHRIMEVIQTCMAEIEYKPLSKYGLTRFFLLSCISLLLQKDQGCRNIVKNPREIFESGDIDAFLNAVGEALRSMIIDLNYEVKTRGETFDYKGDLKSPVKVRDLRSELLKSYEKELAKGKIKPISVVMAASTVS